MSFRHVVMSAVRSSPLVLAGAAGAVVLAALPASAHVTFNPKAGSPGGYGTFAVQVPNEQDHADTTKVEVFFPTDHPIADVSVRPTPGWKADVTTTKLAKPITTDDGQVTETVSKITWSGGRIVPGQFEAFDMSLGPLPKGVGKLYFKTLQTYSSGEVVRWIEIPSGGAEPEHPAPSIDLGPAAATTAVADHAAPTAGDGSGDTTALVVGIAGLVVGLAGLGTGGLALRRLRSNGTT